MITTEEEKKGSEKKEAEEKRRRVEEEAVSELDSEGEGGRGGEENKKPAAGHPLRLEQQVVLAPSKYTLPYGPCKVSNMCISGGQNPTLSHLHRTLLRSHGVL